MAWRLASTNLWRTTGKTSPTKPWRYYKNINKKFFVFIYPLKTISRFASGKEANRFGDTLIRELFNLNRSTSFFKLLLAIIGLRFGHAFFNCFWGAIHKVFSFLKTKRCERSNCLND